MGKEIHVDEKGYSQEEFAQFRSRLDAETKILKSWFDEKSFCRDINKTGIELEGWLVNKDMLPNPVNTEFLAKLSHPQVVPEIAKFNFEINSHPQELKGQVFDHLYHELNDITEKCHETLEGYQSECLYIGTLPTLRAHMLSTEYLSAKNRYSVMNDRVMSMREGKPLYIRLEGREQLYMYMDSVIAECAATSLQIHLSVNQDNAKRYYNASLIASPFLIAISANSPYFFGKELWDESRIAIFEQAVELEAKRNKDHKKIKRVTLGNGYVENCLYELFEENAEDYPLLLAEKFDSKPEELSHLQLHNGTIWRWNRPIVGLDQNGKHHLRIEQRTPSAGPTVVDSIANTAFYIGLVDYLANMETPPEELLDFEDLKSNFYKASRQSFFCMAKWIDGNEHDIKELIQYELFPHIKQALLNRGIDKSQVEYYMDEIIYQRLVKGINGSIWQKAFIHMHGRRFQELLEQYLVNQQSGEPVHKWGL
ncbi:MAG: hypothetical protein CME62_15320 [Halobacteriovoraceae bacterium]|nr:hypothetical protein [Halobacteriovoraceae bacterium]|tara:strand:- start:12523 stop:13965 length:1443 start_codon:yes stop_codon:yes gene_type:complete